MLKEVLHAMNICWKTRAVASCVVIRSVLLAFTLCSCLLLGACEKTQHSPYYNCHTLTQTLKVGMSREEVVAIFGQPLNEVAPGDNNDHYGGLTYHAFAANIRQKVGERVGFQVLLQNNKLVSWSSILSSRDADDSPCASPWSTPCQP